MQNRFWTVIGTPPGSGIAITQPMLIKAAKTATKTYFRDFNC